MGTFPYNHEITHLINGQGTLWWTFGYKLRRDKGNRCKYVCLVSPSFRWFSKKHHNYVQWYQKSKIYLYNFVMWMTNGNIMSTYSVITIHSGIQSTRRTYRCDNIVRTVTGSDHSLSPFRKIIHTTICLNFSGFMEPLLVILKIFEKLKGII